MKINYYLSFFLLSCLTLTLLLFTCPVNSNSESIPDKKERIESSLTREERNLPGVYFYRFEPSFYTGFAPRCQEPERLHIRLGRGNQLRITLVLSEKMIDEYIQDLALRYRIYRKLIDDSIISLSQNTGFEKFESMILGEGILDLADKRLSHKIESFLEAGLQKMRKLNPGKIFHIRIDLKKRISEWSLNLSGYIGKKISMNDYLEILNGMLPTRMVLSEASAELISAVDESLKMFEAYQASKTQQGWDIFYKSSIDLFLKATQGIYTIQNNMLDFYEFTTIYPVGTLNEFVKIAGQKMPLYPFPGKRALHIHQRTKLADHIPDVKCYSYLPWIPYMHVGTTLHNSFHPLWFNINTEKNSFIPEKWKHNVSGSRTGEPYPFLWLLSRGPMSHGCTHVNAGHISELRQILPSSEKLLLKVEIYRNKSNHFDVFDIDGDGNPEAMGVKYYYAYTLKNKKPSKLRADPNRDSFYKWLYGTGYYMNDGEIIFDRATTSAFINRMAVNGKTYTNILLYEADYPEESIQFYKKKSIPFTRELRRVSSTYKFSKGILHLN